MKKRDFEVFIVRNGKNVFLGKVNLKVAEAIYKDNIRTINYDSKTIYLFSDSPFGN